MQVRQFETSSIEDATAQLRHESVVTYSNDAGEVVEWPLSQIAAIEEMGDARGGKEIIGFIAGAEDFVAWSQQGT